MWVTVASFSLPYEAHLARARLEAEGLTVWVADEHTISMQWLYSNALGGVKVNVREGQELRALDILAEDRSDLLEEEAMEDEPRCPDCGEKALEAVTAGRRGAFLSILLTNAALWPIRQQRRCRACGGVFRASDV